MSSYYDDFEDFDFGALMDQNPVWGIDDVLYVKDLRQRKLFINGEIDEYNVNDISRHIMQMNCEDRNNNLESDDRQPILLYITSIGGSVDLGFKLIDVIQASKTPVYTINLGYQYSMGLLVGLAGHKRFTFKNSKFLLHDGSTMVYDSGAKVKDQMEFQSKVNDQMKEYILERTKLTSKEYDAKFRVEWYMFPDEAKEKGFVDYIIGEDCDLDMII